MSASPRAYTPDSPEAALKYAVQHIQPDRAQLVEGTIRPVSRSWSHESTIDCVRAAIGATVARLTCVSGRGDLDLPGSCNWYIPDLAVVPEALTTGAGALLPQQTLLVVEVTDEFDGDTDRVVKRRRYAEFNAPLYLLVDRQERTCTLFSAPSRLGYTSTNGPHPFGTPLHLPAPFDLELDTSDF
ncbi:Uma2 family endonuclease [Streptomyces sp. NPDC001678]|uniref:Uma2 family endonuclease n=1 Tax=Streptomyces sp. NPDC001678 TaxID=3364599 RepID=UPI0036B8AA63